VPTDASLAEVEMQIGEKTLQGEVVARPAAEQIYTQERDAGNEAGIAIRNEYRTFEFAVSAIPAGAQAAMRFVYYQPLAIDTGVGRFVYPLEEGGTDEAAQSFWTTNERVDGTFSVDLELKSAWPVANVRVPQFEQLAQVTRQSEGHYTVHLETTGAALAKDFVFYYRLADDLPGRVEVIPYRADTSGWGTFMAIITPGVDLQPLSAGADYVFVLDVSGSMQGKLPTLADAVAKSLGQMRTEDRFRIVTFSTSAHDLLGGWLTATPENVASAIQTVHRLTPEGGTDLYAGIELALRGLDADRATSLVLVTDGVANTGVVDPKAFHALMKRYDVRVFGFLMGNSANWPLMRLIAEASGGFYAAVSNSDDIVGQVLLAKSKITHEALHDAEFKLSGVRTSDVTGLVPRKIYRGQQLVILGRYAGPGRATLVLDASLTGENKTYRTEFEFPEVDTANPELERIWALRRIDDLEALANAGLADATESDDAVRDLAVQYQIVTDQTAMLVLDDARFKQYGIDRRNRERVAREQEAQRTRAPEPARNHRVDTQRPTYDRPAPSLPRMGGGAIDPLSGLCALGLGATALASRRRSRRSERSES
jgi:Ca-activated chloride channel family protein